MADSKLEIVLAAKDISGKAFSQVQTKLSTLAKGLFSFKGALGGVLGVSGIGALVTTSLAAADAIAKTADKVGLSTDALQELRHAADLSGVSTGTLDMAMQRFSRRLGEAAQGKGELVGVLRQYNIAVTDSTGRTRKNTDVMDDLAEAIKNAGSDQERLRIAFKAFDSEGAALVNMMKNGKSGMEEFRSEAQRLGLVLDEDLLRASERANDQITRLTKTIKTRFTAAVIENSDQIARMAEELLNVTEAALKAGKALRGMHPTTKGESFLQGFFSGSPVGLALGMLPEPRKPQIVSKKIFGAVPEAGGIVPGAGGDSPAKKTAEKTKAVYEDLTDFWRKQAEERYEIMSRSYEAEIEMADAAAEAAKERAEKVADYQARTVERVQSEAAALHEQQADLAATLAADFANSWQSFVNGTQSAKDAFRDFAQSTLQWIQKIAMEKMLTSIFGSIIGASGGGGVTDNYFGLFGSARAAGGPVYPHGTYLVGERGPELLQMGSAAGNVVANNQLGQGGGGDSHYHVNITAVDAKSFNEYLRRNPSGIIDVVNRNVRGNGMLRGAIRGTM